MHTDHQGNIVAVTNASGAVVETTAYSPYQEVLSGGTKSRYSGEGKEYDSLVGDYDFNFRKYKPQWGIFLTPDDVIQNVYDPQLLNRYSFERNSPYRYVDPTGHANADAGDAAQQVTEYLAVVVLGHENRLLEYQEYYPAETPPLTYGPANGRVSSIDRGPGYFALREWNKMKIGGSASYANTQYYSWEMSNSISTQRTASFNSIISDLGGTKGSGFVDAITKAGGTVDVRNKGVKSGLLSSYERTDDKGSKIKRYQYHKDAGAKKDWEKKNTQYKSQDKKKPS
jgi:RHS repeat-associated protein